MFVLLMIICVAVAGCSVSASNSTGRFGLINIVTEQYSISKDGASKMNALVKAVNEEFAGRADKNRHVQISLYVSSTTGLRREFLRKRSNDNRTIPLTTADPSRIGLLNRHKVVNELKANLDDADNELMWKTHSGVYSDTLEIQTSKSILLFVMNNDETHFEFKGQDDDIHGLMAQLIVMVYQPSHDPSQDFKEPAPEPPRNRRNLGDPLAHYFYTEGNVDALANDIDRKLTITQQDCVPNISYKCGERGIGTTSVECLHLKDIGVTSKGEGPVGKPCFTGQNEYADFTACNSSCTEITCPNSCCQQKKPFSFCDHATSTKTRRLYHHGGNCPARPVGKMYSVQSEKCVVDNSPCVANSQNPKCLNRTRCTIKGGCPESLVCDATGFCSTPPDSNDKVRLKNTVQVHLQAGSQVETRTLKQLTFRNHQVNMGFRLRSIEGLKNGVRLVPKVRMVMPLIFGSALDRATEYIMDNITIRIGQSPMLWEMLERFKYEKWAVEDNQKKSNLVFQSKKEQIYFSPDQLIPYDRERYLLFKVPMDPKMEHAIEGKTNWFIINQWLSIGKSDKDMV